LLYRPSSFETMHHTDLCSSAPQSPIQQYISEKHETVVEGNLYNWCQLIFFCAKIIY
jgi:hypothetical protein